MKGESCEKCDGLGICRKCMSTGKRGYFRDCDECKGTGKCNVCGGSGKKPKRKSKRRTDKT